MLKGIIKYLFLPLSCLLVSLGLRAVDAQADFLKAQEYYQKQDYDNAIKIYESMVKAGHVSSEVYYNLGNCYYKTGNVAGTLLNFERAKKLSPDDEDILFNIKVASLKIVDKMDAVPEIFYKRWTKAIALLFSTDVWTKILLTNIWLFFIFSGVYIVTPSSSIKKFAFAVAVFLLLTTTSSFFLAQKSYAISYLDQQAITTSASVYVKSSPDEKGSDQFIIHEGTKMDVLDELGDWKKVRIANGSVGWLKQADIEVI
jgi:tetratricopeptide (TPR) repeat protein